MQIKLFAAILIFAVFFKEAKALKCYACKSIKGWSACNDDKKEMTCPSAIKNCMKGEIATKGGGVDQTIYFKGCSDTCDKDKVDKCKGKEGVTVSCNLNCCTGDLCNAGSVPLVSGFIIMACALLFALF